MPAPTLPYDVLRDIFDNISEDKRVLKQCSLVCRSWTFPIARHLFHRLRAYARETDAAEPTLRLLCKSIRYSERIKSSVRELELRVSTVLMSVLDRRPLWVECPLELLQQLLGTLPHIQSLLISDVKFYSSSACSNEPHVPRGSIDRLDLSSYAKHGSRHGQLSNIFPLFAKIGELSVRAVTEYELETAPAQTSLVQVQRLVLTEESARSEHTVKILCLTLDFTALNSIHLVSMTPESMPALSQLFMKCHSLETLELEFIFPHPGFDPPELRVDLSACTKLRKLHVSGITLCPFEGINIPGTAVRTAIASQVRWNFLCNFLSSIPADSLLATVTVDVTLVLAYQDWKLYPEAWPAPGVLQRFIGKANWKQLDSDLARLEQLQSVVFDVAEESPGGEEFVRMLQERLSKKVLMRTYVNRHLEYGFVMPYMRDMRVVEKLSNDVINTVKTMNDSPEITVYSVHNDPRRGWCQRLRLSAMPEPPNSPRMLSPDGIIR